MKSICLLLMFFSLHAFAQSTPYQMRNGQWRVYKSEAQTIGTVGSVGQIKAGHTLTTLSFPSPTLSVDKLAFWNLTNISDSSAQTSCSSGAAACDLTNSATAVTFAGTNILGASTAAVFGGASYLRSTDALLNPGATASTPFAMGGWFSATNWASSTQTLFRQGIDYTHLSYGVEIGSAGLWCATSSNGTSDTDSIAYPPANTFTSWHHVVFMFDGTYSKCYLDGKLVGTAKPTTIFSSAGFLAFNIGARANGGDRFFTGSAQDIFFINGYALTDDDIMKLKSTKLTHSANILAKRQRWDFYHYLAGTSPASELKYLWYDPSDSNNLFVDFGSLGATDKVDITLYDKN